MLSNPNRKRVQLDCCDDDVLTEQSHKDACDINKIVGRYGQQYISQFAQQFADDLVDGGPVDFHEAMNIVARGQSAFASLPANIRSRFQNNPEYFMEFFHNPANLEELQELGLLTIRPPAESDFQSDTKQDGSGGGSPPIEGVPSPPAE